MALTFFFLSTARIWSVALLGPASKVMATSFFLPEGEADPPASAQSVTARTSPRSAVLPEVLPTHTSERLATPQVFTYWIAPVGASLSVGSVELTSTVCGS